MAAWTLFSNSHKEPVACVCNYSDKPYTFKADSFLGLAEPVVHVPGTGRKADESSLANSDELRVFVQPDASSEPESSDLQPDPVLDSTTGLCTSTLSVKPMARDA